MAAHGLGVGKRRVTGPARTCNNTTLALRPDVGAAEPRRALIRLSCLISAHPYWAEHGWTMAGRVELVRAARGGPDGVRELVMHWNGEEFVVIGPKASEAGP